MKAAYVLVFENGNSSPSADSGVKSTSKKGQGIYVVNYKTDFTSQAGISATLWGSNILCSVNIMAENMCEVCVTDLKGNPVDGGFSFIALGS